MLAECDLMTLQGWKHIADVTLDDFVACRIGNKVEYHKPEYIETPVDYSDLLSLTSTQLDLLVTPDHHLWIRLQKGPHELKRADRLYGKKTDVYFKKDFPWMGCNEFEVVEIPERQLSRRTMPAFYLRAIPFLWFLGWVFSDGHVSMNSVQITQTKYIDKVMMSLNGLGMKYSVRPHYSQFAKHDNGRRFTIFSAQLADTIRSYFKNGIPHEIKNSSKRQIGLLLNAFFYGNGDNYEKRKLYVRFNKRLADDIQELVLKYGNSSNIRQDGKMYVVTIGKDKIHCLETHRKPVTRIKETHKVYSVQVPGGLVFIRRNGKCCWIGDR